MSKVGRPKKRPDFLPARLVDERGLDREQLAREMGITRSQMDKILRGETSPRPQIALGLARRLGISVETLLAQYV